MLYIYTHTYIDIHIHTHIHIHIYLYIWLKLSVAICGSYFITKNNFSLIAYDPKQENNVKTKTTTG